MARIDDEHLRDPADEADAGEVRGRVVAGRFDDRGHAREGNGDGEQRVAIRWRGLHELRADDRALPRAVLDDHLLAESFRKLLGHRARDDVLVPAGHERHDQPDRLVRVLRERSARGQKNGQKKCESHVASFARNPRTCFARSVAAARRKLRSVPVETKRAPIATYFCTRSGRELRPPTPTCFLRARHAAMVRWYASCTLGWSYSPGRPRSAR